MRNSLPGFYCPSDDELKKAWTSEKTLFVFDTNVLLNLYSYVEQTKTDFFNVIKSISSNVWIPHQVALEYERNRITIISKEKEILYDLELLAKKTISSFQKDIELLNLDKRFPSLMIETQTYIENISKAAEKLTKSIQKTDKEKPSANAHDPIRKSLNEIFDGKVGMAPINQEKLNDIYKKGEDRYKNFIPPGYKDSGKNKQKLSEYHYSGLKYESMYGDLILWFQTLEKAKEDNYDTVILVSDEKKEDWLYSVQQQGKKIIGPRAELREEIYRVSDIKHFDIIDTKEFLSKGSTLSSVNIDKHSMEDVENNSFYFNTTTTEHNQKINNEEINAIENQISRYKNEYIMQINMLSKKTKHMDLIQSKIIDLSLNDNHNALENLEHIECLKENYDAILKEVEEIKSSTNTLNALIKKTEKDLVKPSLDYFFTNKNHNTSFFF